MRKLTNVFLVLALSANTTPIYGQIDSSSNTINSDAQSNTITASPTLETKLDFNELIYEETNDKRGPTAAPKSIYDIAIDLYRDNKPEEANALVEKILKNKSLEKMNELEKAAMKVIFEYKEKSIQK